jgi:cell division protein FtsQ
VRRLVIALLVIIPVVLAAGWIAYFSPWLSVTRVDVTISSAQEMAGPLTPEEVRATAAVETGTPLMRVSPAEIEERLVALPQVQSATVTRAWPDALVIDITRREPVALVASAEGYDVVDSEGVVIRSVPVPDKGVPVVRASGDGVTAAIAVAQELPEELRRKVVTVEATTRNNVTLVLRDGAEVMWGSADDGEMKAQVLQALFQVKARFYDVSAPGVPATSDTRIFPTR